MSSVIPHTGSDSLARLRQLDTASRRSPAVRVAFARWGLWVFTAGIFGWIFPNINAGAGNPTNALTDVVIVLFGVLAAMGLPRAADGIGTGVLRWGLGGIGVCQFGQNVVTAAQLDPFQAPPAIVILLASAALLVGVWRWKELCWDTQATPWVFAAFAGFAFEPLYYTVRGGVSPYFPGGVLVLAGSLLCAWAFRPGDADPVPLD